MNVLRVDPQNMTAVQQLGTIWFEEGASLRASSFLLASRRLAPDNLDVRTKLGLAFLSVGQVADARKEALDILQKDPRHGEAALLLADTTISRDELTSNAHFLDQLPDGNSAYLLQAKANLALRANDLATAQSDLERARGSRSQVAVRPPGPGDPGPRPERCARAEQEFKTAASLAPIRSVANIDYANFLLGTGKRDQAKALLTDLTRRAPDYLSAWQLQARIATLEKDYAASLALLDRVFAQDADNLDARLLQADDLLAKDEVAKAVEILSRLDGIYKTLPFVKFQLARAYLRNNNRSQAVVALTQAVAGAPGYAEANLLLNELRLDGGEAQAAANALTEFLKKRPDSLDAQILLADAFRTLGRLDEAEAILNAQIKGGVKNPRIFLLLGIVQRQQNKAADARVNLLEARELSPDDPNALSELVNLDIQRKDYAAALQEVHDQLQKTPDSAPAHFLEASVYSAQKDVEHTETALHKTLELDPNFTDATALLISTEVAANKLPAALAQLDALLAKIRATRAC